MSDYRIGDKFVIEIGESYERLSFPDEEGSPCELFRVKGFNSLVFDKNGLDKLERIDGDYINENFGELQEDAYKQGMNDAWELARKLLLSETDGGTPENIGNIYGCCIYDVFLKMTAEEAAERLEDYEKKQTAIQVGEVVSRDGLEGVVTRVADDCVYVVTAVGTTPHYTGNTIAKLVKTGRRIDIASILAEIRGVKDGRIC